MIGLAYCNKQRKHAHGQFRVAKSANPLHGFGLWDFVVKHINAKKGIKTQPKNLLEIRSRTFLLWGNSATHCITVMLHITLFSKGFVSLSEWEHDTNCS